MSQLNESNVYAGLSVIALGVAIFFFIGVLDITINTPNSNDKSQ